VIFIYPIQKNTAIKAAKSTLKGSKQKTLSLSKAQYFVSLLKSDA